MPSGAQAHRNAPSLERFSFSIDGSHAMPAATELDKVSPTLHLWQHYDPKIKADLYSTAIETAAGLFFVDPIPLARQILEPLMSDHAVAGVLITNANHRRAATAFAEDFAAPIFAHPATCAACGLLAARKVTDREQLSEDLRVIEIQGAAPGEIALYHEGDGGAIIMGDALINLEPYGFSFLPPKYCSDAKQMHRSLRRLLDCNFEQMLFAHGTPLTVSARNRLEQLFKGSD